MYNAESPFKIGDRTFMFRQYVCYNLHERIKSKPYKLLDIEKQWLVFQLLSGLC
jgi:hypothetical protein